MCQKVNVVGFGVKQCSVNKDIRVNGVMTYDDLNLHHEKSANLANIDRLCSKDYYIVLYSGEGREFRESSEQLQSWGTVHCIQNDTY